MTRTARQKRIRALARAATPPPARPDCPTPAKRAYANDDAIHKALRSSKCIGRPVSIYNCVCGNLHLTKKKQAWRPLAS